MKAYGHTKTLFIQAGKYKWSYRYENCIECHKCDKKHKGRGLCTSCWDKERANDPKRIEVRQKAGKKWHEIHKPRKPREEWKKMGPKFTGFDQKAYGKEWYMKWRIAILALKRGVVRKRKGLPYIEYCDIPLPFQSLGKPFDINMTCTEKEYNEWKENMKIFDSIKAYLDK